MTETDPGQPQRRFTDGDTPYDTVIGAAVSITGEVRGGAGMEFFGSLEGDLELDGFLWVRSGARIEGNVHATNIVIEGEVIGNISAIDKLELRSSCRVTGDLSAGSVAISEGGFFEGTITMAGAAGDRRDVTFQEKRGSRS
jgi:cytoskeletal protein CcmA (bactofilin family)